MTGTLTLLGSPKTRAFRVMWMLEELGLDYDHLPEPPRSEAVRRVSPSGKVPVLLAGETAISDSTAILTYLADREGALTAPAGSLDRARQDAMTFRILDEVDGVLWTAARHSFVLPEEMRVPAVKDSLKAEFARNIARLTEEIAGPFVMGDEMSVPDIVLCHCGTWAKSAKFPDLPAPFQAYMERLTARPAYRAAQGRG